MFKVISCPRCGQRLCKASVGSEVEIYCNKCKVEMKGIVDKNGGVYTVSIENPPERKKVC